jgi:hypothetical protein
MDAEQILNKTGVARMRRVYLEPRAVGLRSNWAKPL